MYLAALDPMSLVRALPGNVAQGIIWGIMALGVYITFRILDFADLTVDGSLATGGAVAVMLIRGGMNPALALFRISGRYGSRICDRYFTYVFWNSGHSGQYSDADRTLLGESRNHGKIQSGSQCYAV